MITKENIESLGFSKTPQIKGYWNIGKDWKTKEEFFVDDHNHPFGEAFYLLDKVKFKGCIMYVVLEKGRFMIEHGDLNSFAANFKFQGFLETKEELKIILKQTRIIK